MSARCVDEEVIMDKFHFIENWLIILTGLSLINLALIMAIFINMIIT